MKRFMVYYYSFFFFTFRNFEVCNQRNDFWMMDDNSSQVNSLLVYHSSSQHQNGSNWKNTSGISQASNSGQQKHNASSLMQRLVNRTSSIEAIEKNILQSAPSSRNSEYDIDDESDLKNAFELKYTYNNNSDDEKGTTKHKDKNEDKEKDKDKNKIARTSSESFPVADESDDENGIDNTNSKDKERSSNNIVGKLTRIKGGGNDANMLSEILQPNTKHKKERKWKKYVIYSFNLWSRLSSLIDFFTDLVLLYKVMNVSKPNTKIMPLAISLFVSIVSPYILSYSSGVKLGM